MEKKHWEKPNYELINFRETSGVGKENVIEAESFSPPDFTELYFGQFSHGPS